MADRASDRVEILMAYDSFSGVAHRVVKPSCHVPKFVTDRAKASPFLPTLFACEHGSTSSCCQ